MITIYHQYHHNHNHHSDRHCENVVKELDLSRLLPLSTTLILYGGHHRSANVVSSQQ